MPVNFVANNSEKSMAYVYTNIGVTKMLKVNNVSIAMQPSEIKLFFRTMNLVIRRKSVCGDPVQNVRKSARMNVLSSYICAFILVKSHLNAASVKSPSDLVPWFCVMKNNPTQNCDLLPVNIVRRHINAKKL